MNPHIFTAFVCSAILFHTPSRCERIHLNITSIISEPFLFPLPDLKNGSRYIGYIKDMLDALKTRVDFDYSLHLTPDGKYGSQSSDDEVAWTGMVGEVLSSRADMAAADLTITAARSQVLSFTVPFINADFGLIYKRPKVDFHTLAYLIPFSAEVWITIAAALLGTSLCLYMFSVLHSKQEPLGTISASFYFGIACLFAQGPESYPRNIASRVAAISWWFFSLMVLNLYTASLTSLLTVNRVTLNINRIEDLQTTPEFTYGISTGESTMATFHNSTYVPFQMMWKQSVEDGGRYFLTYEEGFQMARNRNDFAYIGETPYLRYEATLAPCDMEVVQSASSPKSGVGYGFAFPKHSPLQRNFSVALLRMISDGTMATIHTKWFQTRSQCSDEKQLTSYVDTINFDDIRGAFFTFLGGIVLSLLVFGSQLLYNSYTGCCSLARVYTVTNRSGENKAPGLEKRVVLPTKGNSQVHAVDTIPDSRGRSFMQEGNRY